MGFNGGLVRDERALWRLIPAAGLLIAFGACSSGSAPPLTVGRQQGPLIQGTTWFPMGPAPLLELQTYGSVDRQPAGAGRGTVIGVNPSNGTEVFFGTANGGLWHSTNVARNPVINWEPLTDGLGSLAVGSLLLEDCTATPTNSCGVGTSGNCGCGKVWMGTGENGVRRDTYYGAGIYLMKSRRSGEFSSFEFEPVSDSQTVFRYSAVNRLVRVGTSVIASVSSNVTSNSVHGTVVAPAPAGGYGLYKSDNEGPWTHISVPGGDPADASDLEVLPASPNTLFAGFIGKGLFRSADGGSTWCGLNQGATSLCSGANGLPAATPLLTDGRTPFSAVEVATSSANPSVVYAFFGVCGQPGPADALVANPRRTDSGCDNTTAFYRSTDGGTTWSNLALTLGNVADTSAFELWAYPNYTHVLMVDPTDPFSFYFGGLVLQRCHGAATGNGYTCDTLGNDYEHPDFHDLTFATAGSNQVIYTAQDGGFGFSDDAGAHWGAVSTSTGFSASDFAVHDLGTVQFHTVATHPKTDVVIGGMQDNGWAVFTTTRAWTRYPSNAPLSGDGGAAVLDYIGAVGTGHAVGYVTGAQSGITRIIGGTFSSLPIPMSAGEPLAFYPPVRQHPSTRDVYFATNRLYKSTDTDTTSSTDPNVERGDTWAVMSPVLGESTKSYADIEQKNVITAIGLSPSDANRVYLGYYDGEIFVSGPSGPCASASCWTQIGGPGIGNITLPSAAVTSIAVDPMDPTVAYVAYSGFNISAHVLKNSGATPSGWSTFSANLPVNPDVPVHVIAIEPSNPANIWLGADDGVWRTNGTETWTQEAHATTGLPRVPVYDISLDEAHNRAIVATHGRGMWALTAPSVSTKEGWVKMGSDTGIWDIPIYGFGFLNTTGANVPCQVELVQASGNVCAKGKKDATQGDIFIDTSGALRTTIPTSFTGDSRPAVWGCLNSICLPDANGDVVSIDRCIHDGSGHPDPVSDVKVVCDNGQVGVGHVNGAPFTASPTSNVFKVDPPTTSGSFDVLVSVEDAFGSTRILCSPTISFTAADSDAAIEGRIADVINADSQCAAATVRAFVQTTSVTREEDDFFRSGVSLTGPGVSGAQLLLTLRLRPDNHAAGMCFTMSGLGDPFNHNLAIMRTAITTSAQGAAGAGITITERTNLGICTRSIVTTAGESAGDIAEALRAAFNAPGNPIECPASENPVDVTTEGADLITVLADAWTICNNDPQVGMVVGPEELELAQLCAIPPTLTVPGPVTITSCSNAAIGTATATSACGGTVSISNNAPATFPLGDTVVTWTARDLLGNVATATQVVTAVLGDDASCCPAGTNVIRGSSLPNLLIGTSGPDCILGLGGDDQIYGNGGNDAISGGLGNDFISGGYGDDYISGGDGIDHIHGDPGDDTILGGAGNDDLDADDGNDYVDAGDGDDSLDGLGGNDTLLGGNGNDYLDGGSGTDTENGGPGTDTCVRSLLVSDVLSQCEIVLP